MVFVDVPLSGSDHISLIESNMFLSMEVTPAYFQLPVVYHKVLYWAYYSFYQMLLRNLLSTSLLMIQTSTMNPKIV